MSHNIKISIIWNSRRPWSHHSLFSGITIIRLFLMIQDEQKYHSIQVKILSALNWNIHYTFHLVFFHLCFETKWRINLTSCYNEGSRTKKTSTRLLISSALLEDGGNYTCGSANAEKGMVTVYVSDGKEFLMIIFDKNVFDILIKKSYFIEVFNQNIVVLPPTLILDVYLRYLMSDNFRLYIKDLHH